MTSRIFAVAGTFAIFSVAGCYVPPRETDLIKNFHAHRLEFQRLLTMAATDRAFPRISNGTNPPRGMPEARFREYKTIFRELGIENGVNWGIPGFPDGFFVLFSTSVPIGATGELVGYVCSFNPPAPIVSRLPISHSPFENRQGHGQEAFFRPLEGKWYLFYEVDW